MQYLEASRLLTTETKTVAVLRAQDWLLRMILGWPWWTHCSGKAHGDVKQSSFLGDS